MDTLTLQLPRFNFDQALIGSFACLLFLVAAYVSIELYLMGTFHFDRWLHGAALSEVIGSVATGALLGYLSPIRWFYVVPLGILVGTLAAFALRIVF